MFFTLGNYSAGLFCLVLWFSWCLRSVDTSLWPNGCRYIELTLDALFYRPQCIHHTAVCSMFLGSWIICVALRCRHDSATILPCNFFMSGMSPGSNLRSTWFCLFTKVTINFKIDSIVKPQHLAHKSVALSV